MIVRFTTPHYQLLCPGAEPGKQHHAKVVLGAVGEDGVVPLTVERIRIGEGRRSRSPPPAR